MVNTIKEKKLFIKYSKDKQWKKYFLGKINIISYKLINN